MQNYCLGPSVTKWFQAISFLLFFAGIFGNVTVITVMLKSLQELSATELILVSLAGLDVLGSIFLPLIYFLVLTFPGLVFHRNQSTASCQFMALMYEVGLRISIFMFLFAVYSFYRRVFYGQRSENNKKIRAVVCTLVAFTCTCVASYPYLHSMQSIEGTCHFQMDNYTNFVLYTVVVIILEVIIPFFIFTLMFVQLGIELYPAQHHQIQQVEVENGNDFNRMASNKRKCIFLLVATSSFYLIMVPFTFMELWYLMDLGSTINNDYECFTFDVFHLLVCCKCVVNPALFFTLYEGFRANFKRIIYSWYGYISFHMRCSRQIGYREQESERDDCESMNEMKDWMPVRDISGSETKLDDKDHDYDSNEEEEEDTRAILRPFQSLKSTSSF